MCKLSFVFISNLFHLLKQALVSELEMVMTSPLKGNPSSVLHWKTCIDKCVLDYLKFIHLLTFL